MANSQPRAVRRNAVHVPVFPTPESIAAAKLAQAREREAVRLATGLEIDDEGRIAALIGNAIAAAVYGTRGEFRKRS